MRFLQHHRTIQLAVALYAAVVIPGYGWHLVPGCGHDHCYETADGFQQHAHCHSHSHQHATETCGGEHTKQSHAEGLESTINQRSGCHSCGICQILAKAQTRAVAVENLCQGLKPEEPHFALVLLPALDVAVSYSARAPPMPAICA